MGVFQIVPDPNIGETGSKAKKTLKSHAKKLIFFCICAIAITLAARLKFLGPHNQFARQFKRWQKKYQAELLMYIDNHPGEIAEEMFPPFEAIEDVAASVASRRGELEQEDGIFRVIYSDWRGEYEMEFFPYVSHSSLAISHVSPEGPILRHVLAFDTQYCYLQLWSSKRPDFRKNLIFKGGKGTFSDRYGYADIFNNVPVGFPF